MSFFTALRTSKARSRLFEELDIFETGNTSKNRISVWIAAETIDNVLVPHFKVVAFWGAYAP